MNKQREALELALEALEDYQANGAPFFKCDSAVSAIREALAEPEQEPWGWIVWRAMAEPEVERCKPKDGDYVLCDPLYTAPPTRKPLTNEQISAIVQSMSAHTWDAHMLARAIERAHGIGVKHE